MEQDKMFGDVSIPELARMYVRAVGMSDRALAGLAEAAAFRVASAEAALIEADVLRRFASAAGA